MKIEERQQNIDITPYKTVFDRSPSAFALIHVLVVNEKYDDFRFLYANKGYENMSGFSVETLNGHLYSEICGQKNEQWNQLYGRVAYEVEAESSIEFGAEIGRYVNIECHQVKRGYVAVLVVDITDQMTTEHKANQAMQKRYEVERRRMLADRSMMAYAIFNLEKNETVEIVSNIYKEQTVQNTTLESFRSQVIHCIVKRSHRDQYARIFDSKYLIQQFHSGTEELDIEFQRKMPTGKVIWVKVRFVLMSDPMGGDTLLLYACNDINVSKSMEIMTAAVVNADYDLLGYVNFADDSCIMWCGEKSLIREQGNAETIIQQRYSSAMEWFINTAVLEEEREKYRLSVFVSKVKQELSAQKEYAFQLHIREENGQIHTKEIRYTGYDRESDTCMFTQIDVTKQIMEKEREKQIWDAKNRELEQVSAYKTTFLSNMSHEIRTPMNGIIGMTRLALDSVKDETALGYLKEIDESSKYMLNILNDVLDMSRIEGGKFTLEKEWTNANGTIWPCIHMMEPTMQSKNITFIHPDTTKISKLEMYVDAQRLKQVIMNLLNNAYKFTPTGGTVTMMIKNLTYDEHTAMDQLIVSDTGCGMSEDFLKNRIFQPFSQDVNGTNSVIQGTGLGLALVKQIITKMGGSIEVQSELGKGTTFFVTIPYEYRVIQQSEVQTGEDKHQERGKGDYSSLRGKRILVVEDHPLNQKIISALLEKLEVHIELAGNGKVAVDIFQSVPENWFDAVLMDVRMPIMNGYEATEAIRSMDRRDAKTVPIIAMTANAFEEDMKQSRQAGMNEHLSKPIEPELMYETLKRYIGS